MFEWTKSNWKKTTCFQSCLCFKNNVAVFKTAEELVTDMKQEYDDKLKLDEMNIPDAFKLNNGWLDEEEGIDYWPIAPRYYIIQFLMIDNDVEDLSNYKGYKAYSYINQGWLSNISYHSLGSSKYCLMRSECHPSERLRDSPHNCGYDYLNRKGRL